MSATQELLALLSAPIASSPTPQQSTSPQTNYHQAIQNLRDSGDTSFLFLRTVLELTSADSTTRTNPQHLELLFHCILGFRHVCLYRWTKYSFDFKTAARDFLLSLGLNLLRDEHANHNSNLVDALVPKTVANASLASSAAFWKRMWRNPTQDNAPTTSEKETHLIQGMISHPILLVHRFTSSEELFQATESLITTSLSSSSSTNVEDPKQRHPCYMATRASDFVSSLVGEFSGSSGAAQFNSSLEFHRLAHLSFEEKGLVSSLQIGMGGLGRIVPILAAQESSSSSSSLWLLDLASSIVSLTTDVLSWEFGSSCGRWLSSTGTGGGGSSGLVRPPESWRQYIVRPDFLGAVFQVYNSIRGSTGGGGNGGFARLKHLLRQLLLLLSSITGPIYEDKSQRLAYSGFLADGCLSVLSVLSNELGTISSISLERAEHLERETVDMCSMISRLVTNFRVEGLSQLPNFSTLLSAIATVGDILLKQNVEELRKVQGDIESIEGIEWRDESINLLLEAIVLLAEDHWLLGKRQGNIQDLASIAMSSALSPLYQSYVTSRIEMAKMEEHYITVNAADLDETREEISGTAFEEELTAASSLGRINVLSSLSCLSSLFQSCLPRLQELFNTEATDVTPEAAVLLEEARVLIMCICHLLTDDSAGETPLIPEGILDACSSPSISSTEIKRGSKDYANNTSIITQFVTSLMGVAELQASKIAANAHNPHLSPLLATTLLKFLNRWAPAYILPYWMGTLVQNSSSFSSLSLGDLSLPGTHDSISYDLSLTISKDGIDDHETLSKLLRKFSRLYPGEIEEFIRLQAKSQQLDIRQQLDNGIRFIDFRIMFEKDRGEDGTKDKWYCIHCSQSNLLSIQYLQILRDWLESHPHEIVVLWLSRRGSTDDVENDAYPDVPIEEKQYFWKMYTELFDTVLFDTRQSNYLTTPLDVLIQKNHRLVTFVSDYTSFTNNSHLAYDARVIDNYFHEEGVFDEENTIQRQRYYFQNLNNRRDAKWFDLMSMNTPCPSWQVEAAASKRFSPFDGTLENGKWFKSCASKTNIPGNHFCPETLLDIAQLANYYNQITMEEAYLSYTDEKWISTEDGRLFPNAFYMDAIDVGGTIRTGTQLLMGTDHKNALEEHKLSAYAFVDTVIAYNVNTACKKANVKEEEEMSSTDASCSSLLSFIESRRSTHPFTLWNEPYYGRLEGWPALTLGFEERIS